MNLQYKVKKFVGLSTLTNFELYLIVLQFTFSVLIFLPFNINIRTSFLLLLIALIITQVLIFLFRTKNTYTKKYKWFIYNEGLILLLISIIVLVNLYFSESILFIFVIYTALIILFYIVEYFILTTIIKLLFFTHLKRKFPTEGGKENHQSIPLKKLAQFLSIDKQIMYIVLDFAINIVWYGFYLFFCLLIFKISNFTDVPFLNNIHTYIFDWEWVNISNGIGLFSIVIALMTICIPAQRKIYFEAETKYMYQFRDYLK